MIKLLGPDDAAGTVYCTGEMGDDRSWGTVPQCWPTWQEFQA